MDKLELKIPPVAVFIVSLLLIYLADKVAVFHIDLPLNWVVFAVCFVVSGYFGLSGILAFRKAGTTVNPVEIEKACAIVDKGVYRFSRNPMYLGLLLLLFGYGYLQQNILCLLVSPLFVLYMNRFQIIPEERFLQHKFADDYISYKEKVRRWI